MIHFVYILKCNDGEYYTGIAEDLKDRFNEHMEGKCHSTAYRRPLQLKFFCAFSDKKLAAKFEKYLKSHSGRRFRDRFLK